jgi:hypothetical protein
MLAHEMSEPLARAGGRQSPEQARASGLADELHDSPAAVLSPGPRRRTAAYFFAFTCIPERFLQPVFGARRGAVYSKKETLMAERDDSQRRDRQNEPETPRTGTPTKEPGRQGDEPGRQGQGGKEYPGQTNPSGEPNPGRRGTGSESGEEE